jgi:hypothetical protein
MCGALETGEWRASEWIAIGTLVVSGTVNL